MSLRSLPVAVLAVLAACGGARDNISLPDMKLPTYGSKTGSSLASCPTVKCLTVYVAPWCGYCRAATPLILALRDNLKKLKVDTRIIVGLDEPEPVEAYARAFGPDTMLDLNNSLRLSGVPHFYVSDASGSILKELSGYPSGVETPEEFASVLELPYQSASAPNPPERKPPADAKKAKTRKSRGG